PPGGRVDREARLAAFGIGADTVRAALRLLTERGSVPYTPELNAHLVEKTGLMGPTAALLWVGGNAPWDVLKRVRPALGLRVAELELGAAELGRFALGDVYAKAFPADPESLYEPLVAACG